MDFETIEDVGRAVQAMFDRPSIPTPRSEASEARVRTRTEENMAWMQTLALPSEAETDE